MRRLTIIVVVLAALYSAYWVVGARTVATAVTAQVEQMRAEGWDVAYQRLKTRGFPSRFDTTADVLEVTSPDGEITYNAPQLQILALSYQPNNVILAFPPEQIVTLAGTPMTLTTDRLRASLRMGANTALSLQALTAEANAIALSGAGTDGFSASNMLGAVRETGPLPNSYDLFFTLDDIFLPQAIAPALPSDQGLPNVVSGIKIDGTVTLDKPLDRSTMPAWADDPGKIKGLTLRDLSVMWGDFAMTGEGALTVNDIGIPDGTITLAVNDWQGILNIAVAAGVVPTDWMFMARSMGQTLSGGADDLILPIRFQNGNMSVGPIPLGPAPRF